VCSFLTLAFLLVSGTAVAGSCPPELLVLYSNQEFHLRLMFHEHPAAAINLSLYSEQGKLIGSRITDRDGAAAFGVLSKGKYQIGVSRWGRLNLQVRPERGANGPWFTWFAPNPKLKFANGKRVPVPSCPILSAVAN
jgi:hypothetical protein